MDDEGALFEDDVEGQRRLAALLALELGLDRAATVRSDVDETRAPGGDKASEEASAPPSSHGACTSHSAIRALRIDRSLLCFSQPSASSRPSRSERLT